MERVKDQQEFWGRRQSHDKCRPKDDVGVRVDRGSNGESSPVSARRFSDDSWEASSKNNLPLDYLVSHGQERNMNLLLFGVLKVVKIMLVVLPVSK